MMAALLHREKLLFECEAKNCLQRIAEHFRRIVSQTAEPIDCLAPCECHTHGTQPPIGPKWPNGPRPKKRGGLAYFSLIPPRAKNEKWPKGADSSRKTTNFGLLAHLVAQRVRGRWRFDGKSSWSLGVKNILFGIVLICPV